MSTTHHLPLDRRTLHGHFSRDLAAVITVDPGDSVEFQALDGGWHWDLEREWLDHRGSAAGRRSRPHRPRSEIRGARAGQTLAVRVDQVRPRDWGITFAGEDAVVWRLGADTGTTADGGDATVTLAPFLGVIEMSPSEPGIPLHHPAPPARRQHRLQGADRRRDAAFADRGRRRTGVGR